MFPRDDDEQDLQTEDEVSRAADMARPYVTYALLAANVGVWLLTELAGGSQNRDVLLRFGAMVGLNIASGEYWRLLSATFLHSGLMHLLFNSFGLFIFGQQMERIYGRSRFLLIYLLAGLAGSVASYALNISLSENSISVGASGAVFGLVGAMTAFFASHRDRLGEMGRQSLTGLLFIAGINLVIGLVSPGVDNFAHAGGFAGGFLIGLAYSPNYRPIYDIMGWLEDVVDTNSAVKRWWVLPAAALALAAGVFVGDRNVGETPISDLRQAEAHHERGEIAQALEALDRAIAIAPDYAPIYLRRAQIMADIGNTSMALENLGIAMRLPGLSESERQDVIRLLTQLGGGGR